VQASLRQISELLILVSTKTLTKEKKPTIVMSAETVSKTMSKELAKTYDP
jgi:hypothetical protein